MKNLFSIGEVSKQQNISRQTLIFYDKIGLFCPVYTDPDNGYRYYSANQLDYLDTICIMKKIGFSLEEIKIHMKSYTIDHSIIALRKQLAAIERQIEELQMIKSRVEHRCSQLEHAVSIRKNSDIVTIESVKNSIFWCTKSARRILRNRSALPRKNALSALLRSNCRFSFRAGQSCLMTVFSKGNIRKHLLYFCRLKKPAI